MSINIDTSVEKYLHHENRIEQLLDTVGDGTGTTDMVSGSGVYKIVPPIGEKYDLFRMNVYIEDSSKFRADRYSGAGALSNGVDITIQDTSGSICRLTPLPITKIGHWNLLAGIDTFVTDFSIGNDMVAVRVTFSRGGGNILLDGNKGQFFQVNVQDDLSDLVSHLIKVQGKIIS